MGWPGYSYARQARPTRKSKTSLLKPIQIHSIGVPESAGLSEDDDLELAFLMISISSAL